MIVTAGPNPSCSYYLAPRLGGSGLVDSEVADIGSAPTGDDARTALAGALVIFCRYLSGAWMRAVENCADVLAGVGLFLDDDIDALAVDRSVPLAYRMRLLRLHLIHRRRLARHCDVLLVATSGLANRYAAARPHVLAPVASDEDRPAPPSSTGGVRVAFHSTSVHSAEHRWLAPILQAALASDPSLSFEVIAAPLLSRRWRGLPRTSIVSPLPWPSYRSKTRAAGADLLLAPLLPSRANAARSWTKRIDAMRLGAALLVSDAGVYRPDLEEQALGMCVPPEPAAWANAIRELARDRDRLARLRELNAAHVLRASANPTPLISEAMLAPRPGAARAEQA